MECQAQNKEQEKAKPYAAIQGRNSLDGKRRDNGVHLGHISHKQGGKDGEKSIKAGGSLPKSRRDHPNGTTAVALTEPDLSAFYTAAKQRCDPHPEHGARSAHSNGLRSSDDIAGADSGCKRGGGSIHGSQHPPGRTGCLYTRGPLPLKKTCKPGNEPQ